MPKATTKGEKVAKPSPALPPSTDHVDALLALNLGNGYTNGEGNDGTMPITFDFRSVLAPVPKSSRIADLPGEWVFTYQGKQWVFGEAVYRVAPYDVMEQTRLDRYTSDAYKTLFAAALHKAFNHLAGRTVIPRIVVDVPAAVFRQTAARDKIKANLIGDYVLKNTDGGSVVISLLPENLTIVPEGIGAYFDMLMGRNADTRIKAGTWLFLDFGYLTLDVVVVRDGDYLADAAQSDGTLGISRVAEAVAGYVFSETGVMLNRAQMDAALECPTVEVQGEQFDHSVQRDAELQQLASKATEWIRRVSSGLNARGAYCLGGGAEYVFPLLGRKGLPSLLLAQSARRTNIEGLYAWLAKKYETLFA